MASDICCTVVIYGPSGSGKSTLAQRLQRAGFSRIEQMTTREPRIFYTSTPGVVHDETREGEYIFVSEKHFMTAFERDTLAEITEFDKLPDGKVYYGSLLYKYKEEGFHVVTTNIEGAAQLAANEELAENLLFVETMASRLDLIERAIGRKRDSLDEVVRRCVKERKLYFEDDKYDIFPEGFLPDILLDSSGIAKGTAVVQYDDVDKAAAHIIMLLVNGYEHGLNRMPEIWKD